MNKKNKMICIDINDEDKITKYLEKGYDVILANSYEPPMYSILVNELQRELEKALQELERYKNIIDELERYLRNMKNVTKGKYKEALQDTIYFFNALKKENNI